MNRAILICLGWLALVGAAWPHEATTEPPEVSGWHSAAGSFVDIEVAERVDVGDVHIRFPGSRNDEAASWHPLPSLVAAGVLGLQDIQTSGAITLSVPPEWKALEVAAGDSAGLYLELSTSDKRACQPQCTTFVAQKSGIDFSSCWGKPFGNAGLWHAHAIDCGFQVSQHPRSGSIMEFRSPKHVLWVRRSRLVFVEPLVGSAEDVARRNIYELKVDDANWDNRCGTRRNVTYWVRDGKAYTQYNERTKKLAGRAYRLTGFITDW